MADHGLIEGAIIAHRSVEGLDPQEQADLLEQAHLDGWDWIGRTIHHFPRVDSKGNETGQDLEEWWFFRRRAL